MVVRILKTGKRRNVSPAEAQRLIDAKQAVPDVHRDRRAAVIPEQRIERR